MAYSEPYAFSPDGRWLLVGDPLDEVRPPEAIGEDYWLRALDPPGRRASLFADGLGSGAFSSQAGWMAFYDRKDIYLKTFPDGVLLGRWTSGHALVPQEWSPDGTRLAAIGLSVYDSGFDGLFVIEP